MYFICCVGDYYHIVIEQITKLVDSGLYDISDEVICYICLSKNEIIDYLKQFEKIKIFSTSENLYEKYAINNYKNYLTGEYYLYYFHTKSVSRIEKYYTDLRHFCEYFIINRWRLSIELLNYYDCVGINLKNFPKIHYSGNFWWSKSEHLNVLENIDDNYLSPEMYICSHKKTNKISIFQSNVLQDNTINPENLYLNYTNEEIIEKINMIPIVNEKDKDLIN